MRIFAFVMIAVLLNGCKEIEKIAGSFVDYATPPAETYSKPSDPARILVANPSGCPNWKKNTTIQITENLSLPSGCKYDRVSLSVTNQSNLTIDCNGAELNGLEKKYRQAINTSYDLGEEPLDVGILIQSSENFQSQNITIKNCNIRNFVRGIRVHFNMSKQTISDLKNNVNISELENHLRTISPNNITVKDSSILLNHKDGVFVGRYVTGFTLSGSTISSTGAVGLYLDAGSEGSKITNSSFSKNGYSDYDNKNRKIKKKIAYYSREAIAIDSSINNVIEKNTFTRNSRGSIFLYKNCNEHHKNPAQIPRYQSSDGNLIKNNKFNSENIGVWIASRQSFDLKALECGSPLIATGSIRYGTHKDKTFYYEDFAKQNTVLNNTFKNIRTGIIIEDDNNTVQENTFTGSAREDIKLGTQYRAKVLSHPVTGTLIKSNIFNSKANPHIELLFKPVDTTIAGNTPASINK